MTKQDSWIGFRIAADKHRDFRLYCLLLGKSQTQVLTECVEGLLQAMHQREGPDGLALKDNVSSE